MDVAAWLKHLGLEQYEQAFRDNGVDADVLPDLTADDLKDLGVTAVGHRRKLLKAVAALRDGAPPASERAADGETDPAASSAAVAKPSGAERRQLTMLFCDLVGSTELATRLDPEDLRGVIAAYHQCAAEVIRRYEGHVAKFLGDGVLAYFGYPRAHEDDPERAVRTGLELVEAVGGLGGDAALRVRVGIATGLVVVGDLIGEGAAREETVVGETLNLAARIQALAEPGAVVIAPGTRQLLGGLFDLADLGPQPLKGFAAPVRVWTVLGPSAAESRFEARQGTGVTPLVGRDEELALLLRRWEQAKDGEGQVVLLAGEAGIGKSRLLRALRERLEGQPHTPLSHFCSPYHTSSALHPVIGLLERAAGLAREDPPERRLDKLEALLALAAEDVRETAPLLADLLAIPTGARYPPLDLSPQRKKERTLQALAEQLVGLAARQPVLALYEDVHWIDPTSLELLGRVVERVQRLPVLMVITFRLEFSPPWTGHGHVTALLLGRLGRRQGAALVERVIGGKSLPEEVVEQIIAKTDGVPLFVEELTKAVLESGLLKDEGDRYALTGPLPPLAIPATLQDSLMARLDRLAPVREVAQIGAVIGREFSHELLAAVAPLGEAELRQALERLVEAELVFRRGVPPAASYSFKHALVQDAAYQSLLRGKRQRLHARIAEVLEEHLAGTAAGEPQLLAHHYTQAGLVERAADCWLEAGQRAAAQSANVEALAHLTKALELLEALPATPGRDEKERALQTTIGATLIATRGYGAREVERAYTRALELCQRAGNADEAFPVLRGLWSWHLVRAQFDRATELATQLLDLAESRRNPAQLLAAHRALGTTLFLTGRFAVAKEHLERGVALHDPGRHRSYTALYGEDPGIACRLYAAWCDEWLGYRDRALRGIGEVLTLARELSHPFSLAFALVFAARLHTQRREARQARERAEAAIELCAEQGIAQWLAYATITRGWALSAEGQREEGVAVMRRGLAAWRATGARDTAPFLAQLAEGCCGMGRVEEGLALLSEARAIVDGTGERFWEAELYRLAGELVARLPGTDPAGAEARLHQALAIAREQGARVWELRTATSLARLWRDQGKRAEAHDLLAPVYGWFAEGFDTPDLKEARTLLDDLG